MGKYETLQAKRWGARDGFATSVGPGRDSESRASPQGRSESGGVGEAAARGRRPSSGLQLGLTSVCGRRQGACACRAASRFRVIAARAGLGDAVPNERTLGFFWTTSCLIAGDERSPEMITFKVSFHCEKRRDLAPVTGQNTCTLGMVRPEADRKHV